MDVLETEKGELEFMLETGKKQATDAKAESGENIGVIVDHAMQVVKEEFEVSKMSLNDKIRNL